MVLDHSLSALLYTILYHYFQEDGSPFLCLWSALVGQANTYNWRQVNWLQHIGHICHRESQTMGPMVSTDVTTSLKSPSSFVKVSFVIHSFSDKCEVWRRLTKLDVCVWKIPGDFLVFSCSSSTLIVCWRKTMPAKTNVCTQWGHLGEGDFTQQSVFIQSKVLWWKNVWAWLFYCEHSFTLTKAWCMGNICPC